MKNFTAKITVMLKKNVLDPQAAAVERTLKSQGNSEINSVSIGKIIEINMKGTSADAVKEKAARWAESFLSNQVMESFSISVEEHQ